MCVCVIVAERRGLEGLEPKDRCVESSTVGLVWGGRTIAPKPVDRRQTLNVDYRVRGWSFARFHTHTCAVGYLPVLLYGYLPISKANVVYCKPYTVRELATKVREVRMALSMHWVRDTLCTII
jgi:hypothetical protein